MKRFVPILAAALIAASSASANEAEPQEAPEEGAKKEKLICKSEPVTGYRARRVRTCMTQREWDRLAAGARKEASDYVDQLNRAPAVEDD